MLFHRRGLLWLGSAVRYILVVRVGFGLQWTGVVYSSYWEHWTVFASSGAECTSETNV